MAKVGRVGALWLAMGLGACSSVERPPLDPGQAGSGRPREAGGAGGVTGVDTVGVEGGTGGGAVTQSVDASPVLGVADAGMGPEAGGCAALEAAYVVGVETARRCDPTASVPQCTLRVISSLDCGCSILVNDTSAPTAARLAWDQVPCPAHFSSCTPCVPPAPVRCLAVGDGTGRCSMAAP